jgi:hypothetical protein
MTETIEVYIPCEVFVVQIVSTPSEGISDLEQLILSAIHNGAQSLSILNTLFGLGERPLLDIIFDLWQCGHVSVDLEKGLITVSDEIKVAITGKTLPGRVSSERQETTISLLYDLVSGSILRLYSTVRTMNAAHIVRARLPLGSYRQRCDPADLIRIVDAVWHATTQAGRKLRILGANLALPEKNAPEQQGGIRYVKVEITCEIDDVSDQLRVHIQSPVDLAPRARAAIEAALASEADDQLESPFSKLLRQTAEVREIGDRDDIEHQLPGLLELLERLDSVNPGTLGAWHENLLRRAEDISEAMWDQVDSELVVEPIIDEVEQVIAIQRAIAAAERQVVISCPFLGYEAFQAYRDVISEALARGVRIFLIWGMEEAKGLGSGLRSLFEVFNGVAPNFFVSEMPARCHAKFVVSDADRMLITSYNFLNRKPAGIFELSLLIYSRNPQRNPQRLCYPALRLLGYCRDAIYPDYNIAALISASASNFVETKNDYSERVFAPPSPPLVDINEGTAEARAAVAIWRDEWRSYASDLVSRISRVEYLCNLVVDARHKELFYQVLRTATQFIVMMSDQLTADVVKRPLITQLERSLSRNVAIVIVFQRPETAPLEALRELHAKYPTLLWLIKADAPDAPFYGGIYGDLRSHAKVLIADDYALVTSFNFLSFEGYYAGADRHRVRSEVGISVRSRGLVRQMLSMMASRIPVMAALGERMDGQSDAMMRRNPSTPRAQMRLGRSLQKLVEIVRACSGPEKKGESLVEWFRGAESAEAAFDELDALQAAAFPDLRRAVAACLTVRGMACDDHRQQYWYEWITESAWHDDKDPYATLLLLSRQRGAASRKIPPEPLLKMLILARAESFPVELFEEVLPTDLASPVTIALAAIGIPLLLFEGVPIAEPIYLLSACLDSGLKAWSEAALEYWSSTGGVPMPLHLIRRWVGSHEARSEAVALKNELLDELAKTVQLSLPFKLGQLAWPRLVDGADGYRALLEFVERDDSKAVDGWLERHGQSSTAIEELLDKVVKEVATASNLRDHEITGRKRRLCVSRMSAVAVKARAWVEANKGGEQSLDGVSGSSKNLARNFSMAAKTVAAELAVLKRERHLAAPIVEGLFTSLQPLIVWGESL